MLVTNTYSNLANCVVTQEYSYKYPKEAGVFRETVQYVVAKMLILSETVATFECYTDARVNVTICFVDLYCFVHPPITVRVNMWRVKVKTNKKC